MFLFTNNAKCDTLYIYNFIRGADDMYNETTKMAFVSTLSSKQNILLATALFNSIEIFEQEFDDISILTFSNQFQLIPNSCQFNNISNCELR